MVNWMNEAVKEYEQENAEGSQEETPQPEESLLLGDDYGLEDGPESEETTEDEDSQAGQDELSGVESGDTEEVSAAQDFEELLIETASGTKKYKIDFADRNKIKKAYKQALKGREFQGEKDRLAAKLQKLEPEYKDLKESFTAIETAFNDNGIAGIVNLLSGKENAYDEWAEAEYERRRAREGASPEQLRQYELEEKLAEQDRRTKNLAKQLEEKDLSARQLQEERDQKEATSLLYPAFDKFRMKGKLGDAEAEETIDSSIWSITIARLEALPDNVELSRSVVEKEFARAAHTFKKYINKQADQKVTKTIETKKKKAKENIQAKAIGGMQNSTASEEFGAKLDKGNLRGALSDFLSGKVKFK